MSITRRRTQVLGVEGTDECGGQEGLLPERVYDAYGRRTELHTYRGGQNWGAGAWPTATTGTADVTKWVYDEATGLVKQKQDAAAKGASYTYDEMGRVRRRSVPRRRGRRCGWERRHVTSGCRRAR